MPNNENDLSDNSGTRTFEERLKNAFDYHDKKMAKEGTLWVPHYSDTVKSLYDTMIEVPTLNEKYIPKEGWVRVETTRMGCTLVEYYHPDFPEKMIEEIDKLLARSSDTYSNIKAVADEIVRSDAESNPHIGSNFDDFLREEGIKEEVEQAAMEKILQEQSKRITITITGPVGRGKTVIIDAIERLLRDQFNVPNILVDGHIQQERNAMNMGDFRKSMSDIIQQNVYQLREDTTN